MMNLLTRIKSVILFRVVFMLVMGTSSWVLATFYDNPATEDLWNFLIAGFSFAGLSSFALHFVKDRWLTAFAWAQVIWELGFIAALMKVSGGVHSAFVLLNVLAILMSGFLLASRGALVAGALSGFVALGLAFMQSRVHIVDDPSMLSRALFNLFVLILFGAVIARFLKGRDELTISLARASRSLKELNQIHSAIIDHIPSGILFVSAEGLVKFENKAAVRIFGESQVDHRIDEAHLYPLLAHKDRVESEVEVRGQKKILGHHATSIPDMGSVIVFQDLTEIRDLEAKSRLHEKLASIGQLAAGFAHEIRNPLASLSGSIQMLKAEVAREEQPSKLMTIILRETDRLDTLIQDFLNYAKPSELQIESTKLETIFEDLRTLMSNHRDIDMTRVNLRYRVDAKLELRCDTRQLKQILLNLIQNAIQAVQVEGSRVEYSAEELEHNGQSWILFKVFDDGPGVPASIRPRIFDPFFTTKNKGTGLGLALVYQMISAHRGRIWLESEPRKTVFYFELPKLGPKALASAA